MSKFQISVIGIFVICIVAGVIAFATYRGSTGTQNQLPSIVIWGTFPEKTFNDYVAKINLDTGAQLSINYVEKSRSNFGGDFIGALARGAGPDGILISQDMILPHLDKLTLIPYTAFDQRTFMNTFVEEGEKYLSTDGFYALPFAIDPMVMYWNRDMYSSSGFSTYPKTWDEFAGIVKKITVVDNNANVRKSAIALGDFSNVVNAREILGTLMLQSGNPISKVSNNQGRYGSALRDEPSVEEAVSFFSQFVDPNNKYYSWNKSLPNSKTFFIGGNLATYFGFASELNDIKEKNANLNFDVAPMPQLKSGVKAVYGKMYGLSIVRASSKQNSVFQIFSMLTNASNMNSFSHNAYLPSVRRDVINAGVSDPYLSVWNAQALISKDWIDVDPVESRGILGNMINNVTSGTKSVRDAVYDANDQYDILLKQAVQ